MREPHVYTGFELYQVSTIYFLFTLIMIVDASMMCVALYRIYTKMK